MPISRTHTIRGCEAVVRPHSAFPAHERRRKLPGPAVANKLHRGPRGENLIREKYSSADSVTHPRTHLHFASTTCARHSVSPPCACVRAISPDHLIVHPRTNAPCRHHHHPTILPSPRCHLPVPAGKSTRPTSSPVPPCPRTTTPPASRRPDPAGATSRPSPPRSSTPSTTPWRTTPRRARPRRPAGPRRRRRPRRGRRRFRADVVRRPSSRRPVLRPGHRGCSGRRGRGASARTRSPTPTAPSSCRLRSLRHTHTSRRPGTAVLRTRRRRGAGRRARGRRRRRRRSRAS